jgi:uncharacterized RDD family membrane protein YckC
MTQIPAGWYPDPAPAPPGGQPQHRYWDGQQWTEHIAPAAPAGPGGGAGGELWTQPVNPYDAPSTEPYSSQPSSSQPSSSQPTSSQPTSGQPGAYQGSYGQQPGQYGASYPTQSGGQYGGQYGDQLVGEARTPDGQRLAGWWRRLGAYVLDGIVIGAVSTLLGWGFVHRIVDAYRAYFDAAVKAGQNGTAVPSQSDLLSQVAGAMAGITVIGILVSLVYNAVFLKTRAATPGKLALGMRVRLRDQPGPLTWGTILSRWAVQNVATLLNVVPGIGTLASIFSLLDGLWPLWDSRKQALHDKVAKTNVVLVR